MASARSSVRKGVVQGGAGDETRWRERHKRETGIG